MSIVKVSNERLPIELENKNEMAIATVCYNPVDATVTMTFNGEHNEDAQLLLASGLDLLTKVAPTKPTCEFAVCRKCGGSGEVYLINRGSSEACEACGGEGRVAADA